MQPRIQKGMVADLTAQDLNLSGRGGGGTRGRGVGNDLTKKRGGGEGDLGPLFHQTQESLHQSKLKKRRS